MTRLLHATSFAVCHLPAMEILLCLPGRDQGEPVGLWVHQGLAAAVQKWLQVPAPAHVAARGVKSFRAAEFPYVH